MQMPLLVSKFLCYLEAAARMELARISRPCQNPFSNGCQRGEGALDESPGSFGGILLLFPPHPLVAVKAEATRLVAFHGNTNPQTHPEASLLVLAELGRGGLISLLEHDSKAQPPPLCILWYPLHTTSYEDGGRTMRMPLVSKFPSRRLGT